MLKKKARVTNINDLSFHVNIYLLVTWMKNKKTLKDTDLYHFENFEDTYCFEVKDTEKTDAGPYTCVAENTEGKVTCTVPLTVNGESLVIYIRPASICKCRQP